MIIIDVQYMQYSNFKLHYFRTEIIEIEIVVSNTEKNNFNRLEIKILFIYF
jgi:hypothetical protein